MCGLWFILSKINFEYNYILNKLNYFNSISLRGPDKTSLQVFNNYVLGFHRLSIHDLTPLGDQPFTFIDDKKVYHLLVNGEIYNFKELIKKYNMKLKSNSDCEVIYHLYKIKNDITETINELEGEFAGILIINDIINGQITTFVFRDRIGVRPLFFGLNENEIYISSLLSGLCDNVLTNDCVFPPGHIMKIEMINNYFYFNWIKFYTFKYIINLESDLLVIYKEITSRLINAVKTRLDSDRPVGALLSGGLDSSIICGIMSKILGVKNLQTFSIGMINGTDLEYANKVAKHLDTNHTEILFTVQDGLQVIDNVIKCTETWDITTIRASVGQFLLGKYINENTNVKVILNGDGADEIEMGYLYFNLAPTHQDAQKETEKLIKEIHRYDGLRVDRCISGWGLEARVPFLDTNFLDYYMSINPELKIPTRDRIEKQLLRDAFNTLYPNMIPQQVLYRKKEAFSDGVSSTEKSWFIIIQEWIETQVTDFEFESRNDTTIKTKEAYYYKMKFNEFFCKIYNHEQVIRHYWLPNWVDTNNEPSARVLEF
jgi:asparagine synthase (glutamine-hydrolysing)